MTKKSNQGTRRADKRSVSVPRSRIAVVLTTFGNSQDAERIGKIVVGERLAACMTILPPATSVYAWKEKLVREREVVALIKTHERRLRALRSRLLDLHPYETPELLAWSADAVNQGYANWLVKWVK